MCFRYHLTIFWLNSWRIKNDQNNLKAFLVNIDGFPGDPVNFFFNGIKLKL